MAYEVEFSSQARKFLKNLQKDIALRILDKSQELKEKLCVRVIDKRERIYN